MDPDLVTSEAVAIELLLGDLGRLGLEELHQAPVLDHAVLHGDLTVGRVLHHGEHVPEGGHVPVVGRQIVDVETLAVELAVADVSAGKPINLRQSHC